MPSDFDPGTGLGPRLRLAREERRLSARELARRIGCSASLISQIERGVSVPSVGVLYSLATELGSSLDHLLFGRSAAACGPVAAGPRAVAGGPGPGRARPHRAAGPTAGRSSTWPAGCAGSGSPPAPTP